MMYRIVSAIQGITACFVGIQIIKECEDDVLRKRCWLTEAYTWFSAPYFYYDTYAMYESFVLNRPYLNGKSLRHCIYKYIRRDPLMIIHHILLPAVIFPVIIVYRKGLGDYFVGCFFLFEVPILFISTRYILLQVNQDQSAFYKINGILLIGSWTIFRVIVFPYMYFVYSKYRSISLLDVPFSIPVKCNLGCLSIMTLQLYWLYFILTIATRTLSGKIKAISAQKDSDNDMLKLS